MQEILFLSAAICAGTLLEWPDEPAYKDRSAQEWLHDLRAGIGPGWRVIREMGPEAISIAPTLIQGFLSIPAQIRVGTCIPPSDSVGVRIASALGKIGQDVQPLLVEALNSPDPDMRGWAGFTLVYVTAKDRPIPKQVWKLLRKGNTQDRYLIASGLWLGPVRPEASGSLIDALRDMDYETRSRVMQALKRVDPEAAKEHAVP